MAGRNSTKHKGVVHFVINNAKVCPQGTLYNIATTTNPAEVTCKHCLRMKDTVHRNMLKQLTVMSSMRVHD